MALILVCRCTLKGALIALFVQVSVCLNLSRMLRNGDSECNVNFDLKETEQVDLSYMFTEGDLLILVEGSDSPQFLPGLKALLQPFISLLITREVESHKINNSSLKQFKLEGHSSKKFFRAAYGSLKLGRAYQTDFQVKADPVVRLSGSFILSGVELRFLEYNTTVHRGNYIGYNLVIQTDLEVIYMVSIEPKGTLVSATLHLEVSGAGPLVFSDNTNCEIVEKREDLNLGRICGSQVLEEVAKWRGVRRKAVSLVKPVVFQAIWCSFRKCIANLVEITAAYAVMLTK